MHYSCDVYSNMKHLAERGHTTCFSQWCENEFCKLLYLLEAEEDLSQLSLHAEGWLQRPPVDPMIFTPRWGSVTAECKRRSPCSKWWTNADISLHTHKDIIWMHVAALSSEVLYLDLHDWNTLSSVAKSFRPPLLAASALCFLSTSFCLSGWPAGRKRSVKNVWTQSSSLHTTLQLLCMPFLIKN